MAWKSGFLALAGMVAGAVVFSGASVRPAAAQAATSCNGGAGTLFTGVAPLGGALNIAQPVVLAQGDQITVRADGNVLSVAIDLNPGGVLLLFLNNVSGTRTTAVPSSGNFQIDGVVNATGAGPAQVQITCVPGATLQGGALSIPIEENAAGLGTITDNADQTNRTVEEQTLDDLYEEAMQDEYGYDYDPFGGSDGPPSLTDAERRALEGQLAEARREVDGLERQLKPTDERLAQIAEEVDYLRNPPDTESSSSRPSPLEQLAEIFTPVNISAQDKIQRNKDAERRIAELQAEAQVLQRESAPIRAKLAEARQRLSDMHSKLTEGVAPEADLDLKPFAADSYGDPYARDFAEIVSYFDQPEQTRFEPVALRTALDRRTGLWVRASYTDFSTDDGTRLEGDTIMVGAGMHREFWDNMQLGVIVSSAWSDSKSSVNSLDIDTRSHSAGVYARYLVEGLALSARARYGWSDSDIEVGGASGSYDARRVALSLSATGQEPINEVLWVRHTTGLSSTWSERDSYTNSVGTRVGATDSWGGRVSLGPTLGMTLKKTEAFDLVEPTLGLTGSYIFSDRDSQGGQVATSEDDYLSFAVSPGLRFRTHGGASLSLSAQYFGIAADLQGWTLGGTLSVPIN